MRIASFVLVSASGLFWPLGLSQRTGTTQTSLAQLPVALERALQRPPDLVQWASHGCPQRDHGLADITHPHIHSFPRPSLVSIIGQDAAFPAHRHSGRIGTHFGVWSMHITTGQGQMRRSETSQQNLHLLAGPLHAGARPQRPGEQLNAPAPLFYALKEANCPRPASPATTPQSVRIPSWHGRMAGGWCTGWPSCNL